MDSVTNLVAVSAGLPSYECYEFGNFHLKQDSSHEELTKLTRVVFAAVVGALLAVVLGVGARDSRRMNRRRRKLWGRCIGPRVLALPHRAAV